jgi:hypothetical protein
VTPGLSARARPTARACAWARVLGGLLPLLAAGSGDSALALPVLAAAG